MDGESFDRVMRNALRELSRRGIVRAGIGVFAGSALATLGLSAVDDAQAKKKGKGKKKKRRGGQTPPPASPPSPPPPPGPVATYQCASISSTGLLAGTPQTTRFAQTFTATQSGSLRQIQIGTIKTAGSTGDYVVELLAVAADAPTNTVLATVTIPNASVPAGVGAATLTASFSGPALVAGTQYAAAISRPGGSQLDAFANDGDFCAGATFGQNPSGSGTFTQQPGIDLITTVRVLA